MASLEAAVLLVQVTFLGIVFAGNTELMKQQRAIIGKIDGTPGSSESSDAFGVHDHSGGASSPSDG